MTPLLPLPLAAFANPLMLWGLAAASLPILIHLLNRRRFREVQWAAMRFLLAAVRKNQRRVKIEQWLLLAVRTLILICLAVAMAKPALESLGAFEGLGQRRHWVLVLDGSLSMDYSVAETTRFDQAKQVAARLVQDARAGDAFSVVLMADPPRPVVAAPSFSKEAVLKALDDTRLPHGGTDLAGTFSLVNEVMGASDVPRKELVVLTDLQRASWAPSATGAGDRIKKALARLDARKARSMVIDLGASDGKNRAVVDLDVRPSIVTSGASVAVSARVQSFGASYPGGRAQFLVDGRIIPGEEQDVPSVAPGGTAGVGFRHEFSAPGDHVVEVRIDNDNLSLDNRRRLVVPVRESVRVLLVDGDPKPGVFTSETAFLAEALSPETGSPGLPSPVQVEVVGEPQLVRSDLGTYDAVVLANVGQVSSEEAARLDAYLKQGGGVVFFLGDQVRADLYNRVLYGSGHGLLPSELGEVEGDPQRRENPYFFDPLNYRHPIVSDYAGQPDPVTASLMNVKTFRYFKLSSSTSAGAQVALKVGKDPLIVEARRHRGRVVVVGTSADRDWTDWPIHQSYPPVMEKIVLLAASGRFEDRNVQVGRPIDEVFPVSASGAEAVVTWPDLDEAVKDADVQHSKSKLELDGDVARLHFSRTSYSGTYRVQVGAPLGQTSRFAANPDPSESDPAKLDVAALRASLPDWTFDYDNDWKPLQKNAASLGQRGEFHRPFLWAVLVLLLVESVLAWRFSHHQASAA